MVMTFDGISKDFIKILANESRAAAPAVDRSVLDIPSRHGLKVGSMVYGVRIIRVPIVIIHGDLTDLQAKKRELADWLIHKEAKSLTFSDEAVRYNAHYSSGLEAFNES